jgi:hypothetical protein
MHHLVSKTSHLLIQLWFRTHRFWHGIDTKGRGVDDL